MIASIFCGLVKKKISKKKENSLFFVGINWLMPVKILRKFSNQYFIIRKEHAKNPSWNGQGNT
jgi:hypothetical protein